MFSFTLLTIDVAEWMYLKTSTQTMAQKRLYSFPKNSDFHTLEFGVYVKNKNVPMQVRAKECNHAVTQCQLLGQGTPLCCHTRTSLQVEHFIFPCLLYVHLTFFFLLLEIILLILEQNQSTVFLFSRLFSWLCLFVTIQVLHLTSPCWM